MSKREEILEIALSLFSDEGYDNTGVQAIVEAAGVTKPTLYHYFGSKEGLLDELLAERLGPFIEKLRELSVYRRDIVGTLETVAFHYLDFAKEDPRFYKLVLNLSFAPEKSRAYSSIIKYAIEQHKIIEGVFLEAERQHGNMKGKSRRMAYTFIGMVNSGISYFFYTGDARDIDRESGHKLCKQFMHGIFS